MMNNRKPLASAIHFALGASVVAGMAMAAAPAWAQEEGSETEDRIQVTGSRILRDDLDGSLPVQIISRVDIEASGKTSLADLLRSQPINSLGSPRPVSGSAGGASSTLSLRGLGAGRTLILIDGRRAPTAPNLGDGQDLNTIPLAAIERVEILADGASAIYGSDAIGGVVNIITRADFTGAQVVVGVGSPKQPGGDTREASAIFGAAGADGRVMVGVSTDKRDIVFQRQREFSAGGASIFSNNFWAPRALVHPVFGQSVPGDGCTGEGFEARGGLCFYDFSLQGAYDAETENQSLFARASYNINQDWTVHLNPSVARSKYFSRYAPVPSSPWLVGGFGRIVLRPGLPNHPATSPADGGLNPVWDQYQDPALYADDGIVTLTHRFAANGPRDTFGDTTVYDLDFFVTGRVGNYDVEFGARRTESQYYELGDNYILSELAQGAIDRGDYNIYDPFSVDPALLGSFTTTTARDARFVSREVRALISGDLFEMRNGTAGFAFGAEYSDSNYQDLYDALRNTGQVTGSSGGSAAGSRDQWAAYGELLLPIADKMELSLAGRYDDYSDFGNNFAPKVSLRWDPMDQLGFRASWGEGFRAPPLDILSQEPSASAASINDPITAEFLGVDPNAGIQITTFVIANPNLDPESSEQFSFGVVYEPGNWFSASVDYFNIEVTDRVAFVGPQLVVNCLRGTEPDCPPGLSLLPVGTFTRAPAPELGLGVEFGPGGEVAYAQTGFASLGTIDREGFDIQLRGNFDLGDFGNLSSQLRGTYTSVIRTDGGRNLAGLPTNPRWRAIWANQHTFGDFNTVWNINYIGPQRGIPALPDGQSSWVTHDVQLNYFTPWNGVISVGFDNLTNREAVLDPRQLREYNVNLYNSYGRVTYFRYTQNF